MRSNSTFIHLLLFISFLPLSLFGQKNEGYRLVYEPSVEILKKYLFESDEDSLLHWLEPLTPIDTLFKGEAIRNKGFATTLVTVGHTDRLLEISVVSLNHIPMEFETTSRHQSIRFYDILDHRIDTNIEMYHSEIGRIPFDAKSNAFKFRTKRKYVDSDILMVKDGRGLLFELTKDYSYQSSFWEKLSASFGRLWNSKPSYYNRVSKTPLHYIALNQPKFRVDDTLKMKAFLVKKNSKPYGNPVLLNLQYYNYQDYKSKTHIIDTLYPYRPGAFTSHLIIADSLLGKNLYIQLSSLPSRNGKPSEILARLHFEVEDYTLNRVEFQLEVIESDEISYFHPLEKIRIKYSAKDDNGNAALDGRIQIQAKFNEITESRETLVAFKELILDTVFTVNATGDGLLSLPLKYIEKLSGRLYIEGQYIGSNGESHTEREGVHWLYEEPLLKFQKKGGLWHLVAGRDDLLSPKDTIEIINVQRSYNTSLTKNTYLSKQKINIPFSFQNGLPESSHYNTNFQIAINGVFQENIEFPKYQNTRLAHQFRDGLLKVWAPQLDSSFCYIELLKDKKRLVSRALPKGDTLFFETDEEKLKLSYWAANEEYPISYFILDENAIIQRFDKNPNLSLNGPSNIFPGDTAQWEIELTQKEKPIEDVDFLFMAYKGKQFDSKPISTERPREKYGLRSFLFPFTYRGHDELDRFNVQNTANVQKTWQRHLSIENKDLFAYMFLEEGSQVFYKELPSDQTNKSQFSVFVFDEGKVIPVQYFSIDNRIKYFKNFSDGIYSSQTTQGFHTIKVRTLDSLFTIPRIECKEGFKTELVIDISQLPPEIKHMAMPRQLTGEEILNLQKSYTLMRGNQDYRIKQGLFYQDLKAYTDYVVGPLDQLRVQLQQDTDSMAFIFSPYSRYSFDFSQRMIEKEALGTPGFSLIKLNGNFNRQIPNAIYTNPTKLEIVQALLVNKNPIVDLHPTNSSSSNLFFTKQSGLHGYLFDLNDSILYQRMGYHYLNEYRANQSSFDLIASSYVVLFFNEAHQLFSCDTIQIKDELLYCYQPKKQKGERKNQKEVLAPFVARVHFKQNRLLQKKASQATASFLGKDSDSIMMEVEVLWKAPLINATKSAKTVSREGIMSMAVRDITVATQTPGVFQADEGQGNTMRGGRYGSEVYFIDGVKVRGSVNLPQSAFSDVPVYEPQEDQEDQEKRKGHSWQKREGSIRNNFKDYAFFIPDVTTDKDGKASVKVKYPDDIAYWENTLIGIDPKNGILLKTLGTKSFSILSCELALPRYLVQGDSCLAIGKTLNYSNSDLEVSHSFSINGKLSSSSNSVLESMEIEKLPIIAKDSLDLTYWVQLPSGYKDGENRKLKIINRGTSISKGAFYVLKGDTNIEFTLDSAQDIRFQSMQGVSDLILHEAEEQIGYMHDCNEQMASKLKALLATEMISGDETDRKEMLKLCSLLLKNANTNWSWSWWSNSQYTDNWMTSYILDALLLAQKAGIEVKNIEAICQHQFQRMKYIPPGERIGLLYSLRNYESDYAFGPYLNTIALDSLSTENKLKYAILAEREDVQYPIDSIKSLIRKDVFGNIYVSQKDRYSLSGSLHLSGLLGKWLHLRKDKASLDLLRNYVLTSKQKNQWNTIDRAAAIDILGLSDTNYQSVQNRLVVRWDAGPEIEFPAELKSQIKTAKSLSIQKTGSASTYISVSSQVFQSDPPLGTDEFVLSYTFSCENKKISELQVGKKTEMTISVYSKHQAEYVLVEIPLPASCTLENSSIYIPNGYTELKGDKLYAFFNKLNEGNTEIQISILPRFAGRFILNPLRAELMYFPVLNGNSKVSWVDVKDVE